MVVLVSRPSAASVVSMSSLSMMRASVRGSAVMWLLKSVLVRVRREFVEVEEAEEEGVAVPKMDMVVGQEVVKCRG